LLEPEREIRKNKRKQKSTDGAMECKLRLFLDLACVNVCCGHLIRVVQIAPSAWVDLWLLDDTELEEYEDLRDAVEDGIVALNALPTFVRNGRTYAVCTITKCLLSYPV
jgi:hypothetical protein